MNIHPLIHEEGYFFVFSMKVDTISLVVKVGNVVRYGFESSPFNNKREEN